MKRTTRSFEIADPFFTALETMSREMNIDRDTLVNQALFALARTNGFIVPTVVSLDSANPPSPILGHSPVTASLGPPVPDLDVTAPRKAVPPAPVHVAHEGTPTAPEVPISSSPTSVAPALAEALVENPAPAAPPVAAAPVKPPVDVAALRAVELQRMEAIAKDVDDLVVPVEPPSDPEGDEAQDDDDESESDQADDTDDEEAGEAPADENEGADQGDLDADTQSQPIAKSDDEDDDAPPADNPASTALPPDEVEPPVEHTVLVRPSNSIKVWVQADEGGEVAVLPGRFVIGRGDACNLVIDSLRVSREHASIQIVGKEVIIEDLGSSNGTWFNGEKVDRRLVVNGDEIVLGNERVRFRIEA